MKTVSINDKSTIGLVIDEIHRSPILLQLPSVFGLLAAPTSEGARQLDALKSRVPGKNYGTVIGSLNRFLTQAKTECLPGCFANAKDYAALTGAFFRLQFREENFQSKTIRDGTHQGLLLTGAYRRLFSAIEDSFAACSPDEIWNYSNYCAPLCTSCNISGDPEGSIVQFEKALEFGRTRGINLFITAEKTATEKGSYPILGFEKERIRIHREGPGLDIFKEKIPAPLRSW
ncbi:hypothetical protein [Persicitalea sp.]|uniref:hypothetical protein n=1 Tax=Persicitalea sp. TaxID=3100273 RepID=UPI0035947703